MAVSMFYKTVIWIVLLTIMVFHMIMVGGGLVQAETTGAAGIKELNFVFLHGTGGNSGGMQLLSDTIMERIPKYITDYEQANPGIKVQVDGLLRCYPNDVDIESWAKNIATSIDQHFTGKKNLILVGHSMGGKTALYATANNTSGIADKVAMVVTINSPVKKLEDYVFTSGISASYLGTPSLLSDHGVINSLFTYDSSGDGNRAAQNKHWLAFISAEDAPMSEQFNVKGVDALPRNMDDTIVPISAQYAEGADVIYYGEHGHSEFGSSNLVAGFIANQILNYIFGGRIGCAVIAGGGTLEHRAGWLPKVDRWNDTVAEVPEDSGTIEHKNESFFRWEEWRDIVGTSSGDFRQSSYRAERINFLALLTGVKEARWLDSANPHDGRLYVVTRAAPGCTVKVSWKTYKQGLLLENLGRDHYEVEIVAGTPFTAINRAGWVGEDHRDIRLRLSSQAEGPFRWFRAEWRVFRLESKRVSVIDEIKQE